MVLHVAKSPFSSNVAHIRFPAEADKVRYDVFAVEEFGGWATAHIIGGDGAANVPASYIERDALFSEAGVQKLNQLAGLVDAMDLEAQKVLAGALIVEHAKCLNDVLHVAESLDSYELFPSIKTDEKLGQFLVDTSSVTGKFVFSEAVKPYLDYAKIGAEQRKLLGGVHTEQGFVKRREVVQTQKETDRPAFALTLASPTGTFHLNLPASEDKLEQAKMALGLDNLDNAAIRDVEIGYPWAHLLPMDAVTLEDANTLAECVREMAEEELRVFGATLEVEEPRSFHEAGTIAMDIYDYELVDSSERGYAITALRYAGAGDDILEILEGFTDFDALGRAIGAPGETQRSGFAGERSRSKASEICRLRRGEGCGACGDEADGVRETSFGSVKRLSAPWPEQTEQGQTMC